MTKATMTACTSIFCVYSCLSIFSIWCKVDAFPTSFIKSSFGSTSTPWAYKNIMISSPADTALLVIFAGSMSHEASPSPVHADSSAATKEESTYLPIIEAMELEFVLSQHKPLGCTIEESLVPSYDNERPEYLPVFVSNLVSGGNAEMVGLKVGDVITGVSAVFGDELQDTSTLGFYKLQSLVSGRQVEKPLRIRVLRGTNLLKRHEDALMELCMSPVDESSWDSCVLKSVYSYVDHEKEDLDNLTEPCDANDDETECLLTAIWGEEHLFMKEEYLTGEVNSESRQPNDSPWSYRVSSSGTDGV